MTYRIVVGVDGSVHGNAALRWALDEALAHAAEIIAVFAWQMPFIGIPGAFDREESASASWKRQSPPSSLSRACP
jgi:nucleotide-binding universal stress UspA family protein